MLLLTLTAMAACASRADADASASTQPATQPATQPLRFTVATYNINGLNRHLAKVVANIRETQADLVCLQEVNCGSSPYLKKHLRKRYPFMVFGLNERFDGFAILSKAPITHRKWMPAGEVNYHSFLHARTRLGGREVHVAAIHLIPNLPKKDVPAAEQLKHFARLDAIRSRDVARMAGHFAKDLPVIALGDYNCLSFQGAVGYMASRGFIDSAAAATSRPDDLYTWKGKFSGRDMTVRIDYIFHTKHFKTLTSRVIHEPGSDHFPVVSQLTWAAKKAAAKAEHRPHAE